MDVGGYDIRREPRGKQLVGNLEVERAAAMADIEQKAPRSRLKHLFLDLAVTVIRRIGAGGAQQWVRMSPGRRRSRMSARRGGGNSTCTMIGSPSQSAASSATSSAPSARAPDSVAPNRTLIPTMTSRLRSPTSKAALALRR